MESPITKEKLQEIGNFLLDGMSEREACTLCDISFNDLNELKQNSETVRNYIEKKIIKFKLNHLKEIQKNKSEKNSQWLLEKLRPEEFGSRPRGGGETTVNIISQIIKQIQNDNDPIVSITRGARVYDQESNEGTIDSKQRITNALN
jgi:hypothetical protein